MRTRRNVLGRPRPTYPDLDPREIADVVAGECIAYVSTDKWILEFAIQLKLNQSFNDRDYDANALCRGLWMGFDGALRRDGWVLRDARVTQNTLAVRMSYRKHDARKLQQARVVRIAPAGNIITPVAGTLLAVRDVKFI